MDHKRNKKKKIPFCEVFGRDLFTKTPATTQSELFAEFRCIFTRFTDTGILPTILSWIALDDNNGLIMRRPNTGSAAGSKPNVGNLGASVFFDSLFTTCSSKSTIFDLIDLKQSLSVPAAFCVLPESVRPLTALSFISTKQNTRSARTCVRRYRCKYTCARFEFEKLPVLSSTVVSCATPGSSWTSASRNKARAFKSSSSVFMAACVPTISVRCTSKETTRRAHRPLSNGYRRFWR